MSTKTTIAFLFGLLALVVGTIFLVMGLQKPSPTDPTPTPESEARKKNFVIAGSTVMALGGLFVVGGFIYLGFKNVKNNKAAQYTVGAFGTIHRF